MVEPQMNNDNAKHTADLSEATPRQADACCPTMSVPEAGKHYFNLGRNASYDAARRGEIPVIKIGGRLRAIVAKLDEMVGN
jgi:hypothetical protein